VFEVTQKMPSPQEMFDLEMRTQKAILSKKKEFQDIKTKFKELVMETATLFNAIAIEVTKEKNPTAGMCASAVKHAMESFRDLARLDEELFEETVTELFKKTGGSDDRQAVPLQQGHP